ncbi:hypothetical protein GW17_00034275 [Ensete ventricosum]|nr:hypothetical protein GW17_00034275 [Ensete ventricosum]
MSLRPRKRHQVVPAKPPDSLFMGESPPAVAKPTLVPIAESPIGAEVPQGSPPIYPLRRGGIRRRRRRQGLSRRAVLTAGYRCPTSQSRE